HGSRRPLRRGESIHDGAEVGMGPLRDDAGLRQGIDGGLDVRYRIPDTRGQPVDRHVHIRMSMEVQQHVDRAMRVEGIGREDLSDQAHYHIVPAVIVTQRIYAEKHPGSAATLFVPRLTEARRRSSMAIDRFSRPALIIVDMQNDFVRVGAPLEVPEARPTIAVHQTLLATCRARSIPVIYTKFLAGPEWTPIWEWSPQ